MPRLLVLLLAALLASCARRAPAPALGAPAAVERARPAPPDRPWEDDILYFVLVDRFADGDLSNDANVDRSAPGTFHGGDLAGLVAHLDDIASLGVTAIWVNPLVRNIPGFVTGAGFPDWAYHGYWMDDLTQLDPRFGTEAQLRALVDACHARGIKVLLDVVYNHAGYDTRYLRDPKTTHWLRSNQRGDCGDDDLTSCVAGLPDWKTEEPEVATWLMDAQLGWARRSGVDGFRLDTVKHVDHPFWQEHRRRTRAELGPRFFLLGEVWGGDREVLDPWFAPDELDAGLDFGFQGSTLGFVLGRGRTVAFDRYLASRERVRPGHLLAHYLSSHDVPGALFQLGGRRDLFRLAAVLELTTRGIPVVYYGEEVGRLGGAWPQNRSDMPWDGRDVLPGKGAPRDEALREDYRRLIGIRRAHPALTRGVHRGLVTDGDLYVFERSDARSGDAVVVAVNRADQAASTTFVAPDAWRGVEVTDLFGGAALHRAGERVEITLGAHAAAVIGRSSPPR